jgi:hypothetical protein
MLASSSEMISAFRRVICPIGWWNYVKRFCESLVDVQGRSV